MAANSSLGMVKLSRTSLDFFGPGLLSEMVMWVLPLRLNNKWDKQFISFFRIVNGLLNEFRR